MPDVSIVIPTHNDEHFIAAALESCISQDYKNIEIICVDDASTDGTADVIRGYQKRDGRISLHEMAENGSAFQARRFGIKASRAPYLLFLDGDDVLMPNAVRTVIKIAHDQGADVVGFGVTVVGPDGDTGGKLERSLQPEYPTLSGELIIPTLFPVGKQVQGHIWKYLWDVELLRMAYGGLADDLKIYRANDLPITFLALAAAKHYVSTPDRLIRYYWRRGTSGHQVESFEAFDFYLGGVASINAISESVEELASRGTIEGAEALRRVYDSARLSIIGNLLRYWDEIISFDLREQCLNALVTRAGIADVVRAASTFYQKSLPKLTEHQKIFQSFDERPVRSVLLTATNLDSGGAQGVVVSQARHLVEAGFHVTIGLRSEPTSVYELPQEVKLVRIWGETNAARIARYLEVCVDDDIDVAIDHWTLYRDDWPFVALAASTLGVRTIGWIHNFALRPIFDGNQRVSFLQKYLPLLWKTVTLSETDAAFWKFSGVEKVVYLPNPPSPLLLNQEQRETPRQLSSGPLKMVWWGRLQQSTKRVRELIEVASALRALHVDFQLTIVGPDSPDLTAENLAALARRLGVADAVELPGPLHGEELRAVLEKSDLFVGTSAIEGYPLTLVEAQSLGLPLAMYELPWLAMLEQNYGVVVARQHDVAGLAQAIADLSENPRRYRELSMASIEAARRVLSHDFKHLYTQLLTDALPDVYSPSPSIEHSKILLDRAIAYSEQNIRFGRRNESRLRDRIRSLNSELDDLRRGELNSAEQPNFASRSVAELQESLDALDCKYRELEEVARKRRSKNAGLSRIGRLKDAKIQELEASLADAAREIERLQNNM